MANYNDARQVQDKLTELERRMRAVETVSRVESASVGEGGISVYEGGTVDFIDGGELRVLDGGSINIHGGALNIQGTGNMVVDGTAEFRNTTSLKGNTTFGGSLDINSGSLVLPSGSISDSALDEQLEIKYDRSARVGGWGLPSTSWTTIQTASVSAPSWATRASVMMQGAFIAESPGPGQNGAQAGGVCAGSTVDPVKTTLAFNENGVLGNIGRVSWSTSLSNPSGTISCSIRGKANVSNEMKTSSSSWVEVTMIAIFMR